MIKGRTQRLTFINGTDSSDMKRSSFSLLKVVMVYSCSVTIHRSFTIIKISFRTIKFLKGKSSIFKSLFFVCFTSCTEGQRQGYTSGSVETNQRFSKKGSGFFWETDF